MSTLIGMIVEARIIFMLPATRLVVLPWRKLKKLSLMLFKLCARLAIISFPTLLTKMRRYHKFGLDMAILQILQAKGVLFFQYFKFNYIDSSCLILLVNIICFVALFEWDFDSHKLYICIYWLHSFWSLLVLDNFRSKLAFFAGSINSPVREKLLQIWQNDSKISVHSGHLNTSYTEELLRSKFCLHVKGFEVNTARIGDALYYGCVPVIIANHYDLPFQDILNWRSFSVVVATLDIPLLKKILEAISMEEYTILRNNVLKVRKHFQWNHSPVDYDTFYLVMYELWLRRSSLRIKS